MHILAALLTTKLLILYAFIFSGVYIHLRGEVRHRFFRQLTDHSTFMAPINILMYWFSTVPNKPYLDLADFPELQLLKDNWQVIRDEAIALDAAGHIKASDSHNDAGFNSFFRRGWTRFYLKWYDKTFLASAERYCPQTVTLLKQIPNINAAMFTQLPPGGRLVKHRDPYAGSVRYHLGLVTPNSEHCCIYVDGKRYFWRDGEAVLFDETYIHHAENNTEISRIIFFADVQRPMRFRVATWFNQLCNRTLMRASTTCNEPGEKVGIVNRIFGVLYQIRILGKKLKAFNKPLYYAVKYLIFTGLVYLLFLRR